jgi:hypothetical protein
MNMTIINDVLYFKFWIFILAVTFIMLDSFGEHIYGWSQLQMRFYLASQPQNQLN